VDTDSTSKERLIMGLIYIHQKVRKRKKLPLTPSLIKAREEHKKFLDSIGYKKIARKHFQAFNDINYTFGREEDKPKEKQIPLSNKIGTGGQKSKDEAWKLEASKRFTVAPAYNKGAYQVISKQDVKDIGK